MLYPSENRDESGSSAEGLEERSPHLESLHGRALQCHGQFLLPRQSLGGYWKVKCKGAQMFLISG